MTSGADLFVVCKQCGSEVSPYITECPYCGHRLRRRAPKLPPARAQARSGARSSKISGMLPRRRATAGQLPRTAVRGYGSGRWEASRPYATLAIVAASCAMWVACHARPALNTELAILGPLHGDWWRLLSHQFIYGNGIYAFATLVAVSLFGWLLERRHGPVLVLALFLGAGVTGGLVAEAVYPAPIVSGADAGALALLAAWAVPDLRNARAGGYYDGDLIGVAVFAALLLALPFAIHPLTIWELHIVVAAASWLAGVTGALIGLLVGTGISAMAREG